MKTNLKEHTRLLVKEMEGIFAEKNISIDAHINDLPEIYVDPDRVMQVLRNLLINAFKFSANHSVVILSVHAEEERIVFIVKDFGVGIAKENQKKLFEPFFQEEQSMYRQYGGAGLGLAICRGIVEAQNGKIWVESEKGNGATFYFTVPIVPVKEPRPIRLLFSGKKSIEYDLEKRFVEALGPLGKTEFELLKEAGKLEKKDILSYIEEIRGRGIINQQKAKALEGSIIAFFE